MSRATEREAEARASDLERALRAIGRIIADVAANPRQRLDQIGGIVRMYGCEPAVEKLNEAT